MKNDPHEIIADAILKHKDPDDAAWFNTLLCSTIEALRPDPKSADDARRCVQVAEAAFKAHPKDESKPADDDADALFAAKE